ncbi:MAG: hypothetical protein OHK0053_34170 [Microscillaceae bacterium]
MKKHKTKAGNLLYVIEAEAKIFAADSKIANTSITRTEGPDTINIKTMAGLIRGTKKMVVVKYT